jgi:acyl transferase domain-containing protein
MATEEKAATAEEAVSAQEATEPKSEIEILREENAELKHQFKSAQGRLRVNEANAGHAAEAEERMTTYMTNALKTVVEEVDPQERIKKIQELAQQQEADRQLRKRITTTQIELDKLLTDSQVNWENDPDLADARDVWNASKPEDALRLASLVLHERKLKNSGYVSEEEVDRIVDTKLKNARQSGNAVDTGNSTVAKGLPDKKPGNPAELQEYLATARSNGIVIGKQERNDLVRGALSG